MAKPKFDPTTLELDIDRWLSTLRKNGGSLPDAEIPTFPVPPQFFPADERNEWLQSAMAVLVRAGTVVARLGPRSVCVLCLPMSRASRRLGLNFDDAETLVAQLELDAPFIYTAEPHEAPWDLEAHFTAVPPNRLGPPTTLNIEAMLDEYEAIPGYRYERNLHLVLRQT